METTDVARPKQGACHLLDTLIENPKWKWLADESARQSMESARQVWDYFGVGDRVDVSIVGGHPHCQLPQSQYQLVGDYIDRFLLGK